MVRRKQKKNRQLVFQAAKLFHFLLDLLLFEANRKQAVHLLLHQDSILISLNRLLGPGSAHKLSRRLEAYFDLETLQFYPAELRRQLPVSPTTMRTTTCWATDLEMQTL